MWSTLFPAPGITQGVTAGSGASLNSSFGFSFGSFHVSEAEDFVLPHLPESQPIDSGYFSCPASSVSTDSEPDLPNQARRRLSSNADTPDYGSLCSLQRRWLSAIESSLAPSSLPPPLPLAGSAPQFPLSNGGTVESGLGSRTASLLPQKQERGIATLGLAILVRQPLEQSREALFIRTAVMEDIFSALVHSVQEAYIHKRRFVATLHRGWQDVQKAIFSQWTVSQLARLSSRLNNLIFLTRPHSTTTLNVHNPKQFIPLDQARLAPSLPRGGGRPAGKVGHRAGLSPQVSATLDPPEMV